jgi:hypothetical protein
LQKIAMFFFLVSEGGIEKDGGGWLWHQVKVLGSTLGTLKLFFPLNNKGARVRHVTKKDARDSVTVAMLGSVKRNAEIEKESFSWAQGLMPGGAKCIKKVRRGFWGNMLRDARMYFLFLIFGKDIPGCWVCQETHQVTYEEKLFINQTPYFLDWQRLRVSWKHTSIHTIVVQFVSRCEARNGFL